MSNNNNGVALVPEHLAIIMDGNGRWAKKRILGTSRGHRAGVEALRTVLRAARARGVRYMTVYAFSSENWKRSNDEVSALMGLLKRYLANEVAELKKEGVKLVFIGRRDRLSSDIVAMMEAAEAETADRDQFQLNLAVDYGGQWDIAHAAQQLAQCVADGQLRVDDIDETSFHRFTALAELPPPDLLIRTGGDLRISNYLLWQSAYTEFYFCDTLWPDFGAMELDAAIDEFATRQRRYGGRVEDHAC
ncbi:MAG TPA: polyprenyl diphosphate synthase [Pseudomonadales bacterium]|nr:polyprenyl diphosphate synthase [Pseudomonadales bacterium]